jgi:hypothetical protein
VCSSLYKSFGLSFSLLFGATVVDKNNRIIFRQFLARAKLNKPCNFKASLIVRTTLGGNKFSACAA